MNRERRIIPATSDRLITADASKVSGAEFYGMVKSAFSPAPTRLSERADVARMFIYKSWGRGREETERLRAEMNAELEAIDARWLHKNAMQSREAY